MGPKTTPPGYISSDEALDRVRRNNVLTFESEPFHAELRIAPDKGNDPAYTGSVEVFWANPVSYRLVARSRDFDQTLVVDRDRVSETDRGDFYPNWLQSFVTALLDPMPRLDDLRGQNEFVATAKPEYTCITHDKKPSGVNDGFSYARVCFDGPEPHLEGALGLTYNIQFKDYKEFGAKRIARTYYSGFNASVPLRGTLVTLESWNPDPNVLTVTQPTPATSRIHTTLVSTATRNPCWRRHRKM